MKQLAFAFTPGPPVIFTIYRHVHRGSQKCYVGLTKQGMERRWKQHVRHAKAGRENSLFHNAIRKYGPDEFDHEVLEECATVQSAKDAEEWWIAHFGSNDRAVGYNLTSGGDTPKHSAEVKEKIRQAKLAYYESMTPEQRKKACGEYFRKATPEQRKEMARRAIAGMTPEQLSARARKREAAKSQERKKEIAAKSAAAISPEKRREMGQLSVAAKKSRMTDEQWSETMRNLAKAQNAAMTPEERAERSRKMNEARRAKRARERAAARSEAA